MCDSGTVHVAGCDTNLSYVVLPTHTLGARVFGKEDLPYARCDSLQDAMRLCASSGHMSAVGVACDVDDSHVFVDLASPYLGVVGERGFSSESVAVDYSRDEVLRAGRFVSSSAYAMSDCRHFALAFLVALCDRSVMLSDELFERIFSAGGRYGYVSRFAQELAYMGCDVFTELHPSFCAGRLLELVDAGYAVAFLLEHGTLCPYPVGETRVLDVRHCAVLVKCAGKLALVDTFGAHDVDRATVESFGDVSGDLSGHDPWYDGFMLCGVRKGDGLSENMVMHIDEVCDIALSLDEEAVVSFDDLEVVRTDAEDATRVDLTAPRSFSINDPLLVYKLRAMCKASLDILKAHDACLHVIPGDEHVTANIVSFEDQPQPQKTMIGDGLLDDGWAKQSSSWDFEL